MPAPPVTLVCFATPPGREQVRASLAASGCSVSTLAGGEWLRSGAAQRVPIVLFLAEPEYPRRQILDALQARPVPTLVIYDPYRAFCDVDIVRHCSEFISWPCPNEELRLRLERLMVWSAAEALRESDEALRREFLRFNMIGRSPAFLAALHTMRKLAGCDAPVLVEGETGTGKEMAARAVHYLSARRDRAFIPVNCGAIPDNLFENEMFGHARGAYTDAKEAQPGVVALAEGGTLFLDEVDALSAKGQVALLRFLQDQQYRPLGGRETRVANVRMLAAANVDLAELVARERFRADLLYRLRVLSLSLPPLRERGDDIVLLAEHFLEGYRSRYGQPHKRFAPELTRWLLNQPWPGNVRELDSVVHREFVLADGELVRLRPELAGVCGERRRNLVDRRRLPAQGGALSLKEYKARAVAELEKSYLLNLYQETGGNVSLAARRSGKERRALGKLFKKYGIARSIDAHRN